LFALAFQETLVPCLENPFEEPNDGFVGHILREYFDSCY